MNDKKRIEILRQGLQDIIAFLNNPSIDERIAVQIQGIAAIAIGDSEIDETPEQSFGEWAIQMTKGEGQ